MGTKDVANTIQIAFSHQALPYFMQTCYFLRFYKGTQDLEKVTSGEGASVSNLF